MGTGARGDCSRGFALPWRGEAAPRTALHLHPFQTAPRPSTHSCFQGSFLPLKVQYFVAVWQRGAWGLGLNCLLITLLLGWGRWVRPFLQHHVFACLARLTYAAYLIHPICMMVYFGNGCVGPLRVPAPPDTPPNPARPILWAAGNGLWKGGPQDATGGWKGVSEGGGRTQRWGGGGNGRGPREGGGGVYGSGLTWPAQPAPAWIVPPTPGSVGLGLGGAPMFTHGCVSPPPPQWLFLRPRAEVYSARHSPSAVAAALGEWEWTPSPMPVLVPAGACQPQSYHLRGPRLQVTKRICGLSGNERNCTTKTA